MFPPGRGRSLPLTWRLTLRGGRGAVSAIHSHFFTGKLIVLSNSLWNILYYYDFYFKEIGCWSVMCVWSGKLANRRNVMSFLYKKKSFYWFWKSFLLICGRVPPPFKVKSPPSEILHPYKGKNIFVILRAVVHIKICVFRIIALVMMCLLGFGSYFCFDNPGALQSEIKVIFYWFILREGRDIRLLIALTHSYCN